MNKHDVFAQRIGLVGIVSVLASLSQVILLPILTKTLPVEQYGMWIQVAITIELIPAAVTLGLPLAMVRFLAPIREREKIQEGFFSIVVIVLFSGVVVSSCILLFSQQVANALFNGNLIVTRLLAPVFFFACLNAPLINYFRTFQQIKRYSLFILLQAFLSVALIAFFIILGYGIEGALVGYLTTQLVLFGSMSALIMSAIGAKRPHFTHAREYLSFGMPTIPVSFSYWVVNSSDRYIIGFFLGVAFVGYYSPGYALGNAIILMITPLTLVLPAQLAQYYDDGRIKDVQTVLRYALKYFLMAAIPTAIALSLLSKPLLILLSTPAIASQGYTVVPFIVTGAVLFGATSIVAQVLVLRKRTLIIGIVWSIGALLNLALNLYLVPHLGIIGAAISTLASFSLVFVAMLVVAVRYVPVTFDARATVKIVGASAISSLGIIVAKPTGFVGIIAVCVVVVVLYFGILVLTRGLTKDELLFFKGLILRN